MNIQNRSASANSAKPTSVMAARKTIGRRRSPSRSAWCGITRLVTTRGQNDAAMTRPISAALRPRASSQTGQKGACTPTTANTAP